MSLQEKKTIEFFDRISGNYSDKYTSGNKFHQYFFNQRLQEATKSLNGHSKVILDIGTGTGNLFDYLKQHYHDFEFYGTDISKEMIRQSRIPIDHQYVGKCYELDLPVEKFDYIFMLGVTTYMTMSELQRTLQFVSNRLKDDGNAIISFTNQAALDNFSRKAFKLPIKLFKSSKHVMGQSFKIFTYKEDAAKQLFKENFELLDVRYLNHTVFPFNLIVPGMSINIASYLHEKLPGNLLRLLSSDFLFVIKPKAQA